MPRRVLIVDDQEDILLILEREFRKAPDLQVTSASKYADALALIPEKQIDLVISDVRLGRDSGFDLVREINQSHPEVASILMSAYRSSSNREQAESLGVLLFLEKPFQISNLIQQVKNYFEEKEKPAPEPEPEPVAPPVPSQVAETNTLSHFKLQDLVQLFCLNGRNILITISNPANQLASGVIYIQRGRVIHAADYNGKSGTQAFHALMRLESPNLNVKDWNEPVPVSIDTGWEHLLLQSAIEIDEEQEEPTQIPGKRMTGGM